MLFSRQHISPKRITIENKPGTNTIRSICVLQPFIFRELLMSDVERRRRQRACGFGTLERDVLRPGKQWPEGRMVGDDGLEPPTSSV
jgi:hypothetical protein